MLLIFETLIAIVRSHSGEPLVIFLGTEGSRFSRALQKEPQAIHTWGLGRCLSVQAVEAGRAGDGVTRSFVWRFRAS